MPNRVATQIFRSMDWVLCKTAGLTFNTIQHFNKRNPNPSVTPQVVGQAASEILGKDQAHPGIPAADRFALPRLRQGSARGHHRRQERLARLDERESRRN